jgi:hypothetical protein
MRDRTFHPWVSCLDGPLAGATLTVVWHWAIPPAGIWLTRLDDGRVVGLGPEKDVLNAIANRFAAGGTGWLPYRRDRLNPDRRRGPDGSPIDVWRYRLNSFAAPVRPHRRQGLPAGGTSGPVGDRTGDERARPAIQS